MALAVARTGSVRGAATALLVSHATVSRHLAALQQTLGVRLFVREGRGLQLTAAGIDLVETAKRIERDVDATSRRVAGRDVQLRGVVRVAVPPSVLRILAVPMATFAQAHPEIRVEFVTGLELVNLTRREADIAVRLTEQPRDTLVGRKVALFEVAAYGLAQGYHRGAKDFDALPWVDWDDKYRDYLPARWLAANIDRSSVRATADSETSMFDLVRAGVGVGFVPCLLAASDPCLVEVDAALPRFTVPIWVLTHPDLRDTGRVRAVMRAISEALVAGLANP